LVARFLGELGLLDALFELASLVAAVLAVAELLLDRLHLLVQVVLALRLLHLALDARADALLDLQDRDLAFHEAETFSSRSLTDRRASSISCFSAILIARCEATVSASFECPRSGWPRPPLRARSSC
jgi:hypothetical protein